MSTSSNLATMKKAPERTQSDRKWGAAVMSHGMCILPSLLLRAQARLLLNSTQMIVLLQLVEHWWSADGRVFPSLGTIAERIDMTPKTVQRTVDALVAKGLISKTRRMLPGRGNASNEYSFDGLVKRLKDIEKDFAQARAAKKAAAKPGGLVANKG